MKRTFALVALLAALAVPATTMAGGPTVENLQNAGWECYDLDGPGPLEIHCFSKANEHQVSSAAINAMVFDPVTHEFLATEIIRFTSQDLSAIPCPAGGGTWEDLGFAWACHHWK
jgi:hypothetical protein